MSNNVYLITIFKNLDDNILGTFGIAFSVFCHTSSIIFSTILCCEGFDEIFLIFNIFRIPSHVFYHIIDIYNKIFNIILFLRCFFISLHSIS